jgi:hypothetical protein
LWKRERRGERRERGEEREGRGERGEGRGERGKREKETRRQAQMGEESIYIDTDFCRRPDDIIVEN